MLQKCYQSKWSALATVVLSLGLFGFMLYANTQVPYGGPVENAVLDPDHPVNIAKRHVDTLCKAEGFCPGGVIMFSIPLMKTPSGVIVKSDLEYIAEFTRDLERSFKECCKVWSLAKAPRFRVKNEQTKNHPYISPSVLEDYDSHRWIKEAKKDPGIVGIYLQPDPKTNLKNPKRFIASNVFVTIPRGKDEVKMARKVMTWVAGWELEELKWYSWFFIGDIPLRDELVREFPNETKKVLPGGWTLGRIVMHGATWKSLLTYLIPSALLAAALFLWAFLGNIRQPILGLSAIGVNLICTRGAIAVLNWIGFELYGLPINERVYFVFVPVLSFALGVAYTNWLFHAYTRKREEVGETASRAEVWHLLGLDPKNRVSGLIISTATVVVIGFLLLSQIGVRASTEIGILSAISAALYIPIVLALLPAGHVLIGGEYKATRISKWLHQFFDCVAKLLQRIIYPTGVPWKQVRVRCWTIIGSTIAFIALSGTACVFWLQVETHPLQYIKSTVVHKASERLNLPGGYGFGRIPVKVRWALRDEDEIPVIEQPEFLSLVDRLSEAFRKDPALRGSVRQVHSALNYISVYSREHFNHPLPKTRREALATKLAIKGQVGPKGVRQLWSKSAVVVFVSAPGTNSNSVQMIVERIREIGQTHFPELALEPFDLPTQYAASDQLLRTGKFSNVLLQLLLVFMAASVIFFLFDWRYRERNHSFVPWYIAAGGVTLVFAFASAVMFTVMMIGRIPLDQANSLNESFTVGVAFDLAMLVGVNYYLALYFGENRYGASLFAVRGRGQIPLVDATIGTVFFLVLVLSPFVPISRVGWMMATMLITSALASLIILHAVLVLGTREKSRVNPV